jgi:hypothetical protein
METFTFNILEECDFSFLNEKEKYWINFYKSNNYEYGYNKNDGGNKNAIVNNETREKISKLHKGSKRTEETKINMSKSQKGKIITEECKNKISKTLTGTKLSEEHKKNISIGGKGRITTDEARINMSKAQKGRKLTEEHKQKLSQSKKGKPTWNKGLTKEDYKKRVD